MLPDNETVFPRELCELSQLRTLYIGAEIWPNDVTVPNEISALKKLRYLDLRTLGIEQLPSSIGQLSNLRMLCLTSDYLTEPLPNEIGALLNLRFLDCSGQDFFEETPSGQLSVLPTALWHFKKLQHLYLSKNRLAMIPDEIQHLISLKNVYMGGNPLERIPDTMQRLPSLEVLDAWSRHNSTISFALLEFLVHGHEFAVADIEDNQVILKVLALKGQAMANRELTQLLCHNISRQPAGVQPPLMTLCLLTRDHITFNELNAFNRLKEEQFELLRRLLAQISSMNLQRKPGQQ